MAKKKIGIIGCGTIGSALAEFILRKLSREAELRYLSDHHPFKAKALIQKLRCPSVRMVAIPELIRNSEVIIEAASAGISAEIAKASLRQHKQVLVLSAGGLVKRSDWLKSLQKTKGKLWIPSGAVAGIDGVMGAAQSGLRKVTLVTRKPPRGIQEAPYFQKHRFPALKGKRACCVFRGNALEAVRGFPQNVNVAAVLSLAGLGARETEVQIWTSRKYRHNEHEIFVESRSGKMQFKTRNVPSAINPKTSALAVYSAMAVLKRIFSPLHIGT